MCTRNIQNKSRNVGHWYKNPTKKLFVLMYPDGYHMYPAEYDMYPIG